MKTRPKSIFSSKYKILITELIRIRKEKELSQRELSSLAKESHNFIARTETRERRLDILETINLLKAMGLSKSDILKIIEKLI